MDTKKLDLSRTRPVEDAVLRERSLIDFHVQSTWIKYRWFLRRYPFLQGFALYKIVRNREMYKFKNYTSYVDESLNVWWFSRVAKTLGEGFAYIIITKSSCFGTNSRGAYTLFIWLRELFPDLNKIWNVITRTAIKHVIIVTYDKSNNRYVPCALLMYTEHR